MSISRELSKFIEPGGSLFYDNTTSGLSATTIKSAIDELNTLLGGGNIGSQATFEVYDFTATAAQTTFSLSSNHGKGSNIAAPDLIEGTVYIITDLGDTDFTLIGASSNTVGITFTKTATVGLGTGTAKVVATYVPGYIQVYVNGVFLSETDYVASDGDNVVLDTGADVGALVTVVTLDSFNTATQLRVLNVDAGAPDNSVSINSSGNLVLPDNSKAIFGAGSDLQIYHDGSNSFISDQGTGHLKLLAGDFRLNNAADDAQFISAVNGAEVNLYYDGSAKLATTATGIDVTGSVTADGGDFSGLVQFNGTAGIQLDNAAQVHTWTLDDNFTSRLNIATTSAAAAWKIGSNNNAYLTVSPTGIDVTGTIKSASATQSTLYLSDAAKTTGFLVGRSLASNDAQDFFIYDVTAASTRLAIDASGQVGIGTSSPNSLFHIYESGSGDATLEIDNTQSGTSTVVGKQGSSAYGATAAGNAAFYTYDNDISIMADGGAGNTSSIKFSTGGNTERMRIDSSGNVKIADGDLEFTATQSNYTISVPDVAANIFNTGDRGNITIKASGSTSGSQAMSGGRVLITAGNSHNGQTGDIVLSTGANLLNPSDNGVIRFNIGGTSSGDEAMRIDSSGRILIGKTVADSIGTDGIELDGANDRVLITRSNSEPLVLNRKTSDGPIANFYKDNAAVGSIGSQSGGILELISQGTELYVGTSGNAESFFDAPGGIAFSTFTAYDGLSDLGRSIARFKDLYLSGTVALTTADNASAANMFVSPSTDFLYLEHPANGMIFRNTAGTEAMRIDSSANLDVVGRVKTQSDLNVYGGNSGSTANRVALCMEGAGASRILVNGPDVGTNGSFKIDLTNSTGTVGHTLTYDSSGNVGIGRTPDANGVLQLNVASGLNTNLTFAENSVNKWMIGSLTSSNALRFYDLANSREVMRLDASGFLNVGATGTAGTVVFKRSSDGNGAGAISVVGDDFVLNTGFASANMIFKNVTSESMRLDTSGNLLVGTTTTPSLTGLAVGSTTTGKNISVFSSSNGNNGIIGVYQSNGTQEGQLYAGTGDINLFGTSVVKVVATSGGVQLTSGATSWTAISDERVKDIIEPITNAAQKVSSLRAVIGKYKTDLEGTRRSFLIAQDVQAVLPEAIDATDEDNLGVRYTETIPLLVAAIQEQQATIEALTARIAALES